MRKSALVKINGFDTGFTRSEDFEITLRFLKSGFILATCPEAFASVVWDRGVFEYLVLRYFETGYFSAKAHLVHDMPVFSFLKIVKSFIPFFSKENKLSVFTKFSLTVVTFFLHAGFQVGIIKFKNQIKWQASPSIRNIVINRTNKVTVYGLTPFWGIVVNPIWIKFYSFRFNRMIVLNEAVKEICHQLFLQGSYTVKANKDEEFIQFLLENEIIHLKFEIS